jgi:putative redox protein
MKISLLSDDAVRVEPAAGQMTVEADAADRQFSPFHMLAAGLGYCTWSVLYSWAEHAKLPVEKLAVEVRWTFAEEPHRVGTMTMKLDWPDLPPNRHAAAKRAAALCAVHQTLHHPPTIDVELGA